MLAVLVKVASTYTFPDPGFFSFSLVFGSAVRWVSVSVFVPLTVIADPVEVAAGGGSV